MEPSRTPDPEQTNVYPQWTPAGPRYEESWAEPSAAERYRAWAAGQAPQPPGSTPPPADPAAYGPPAPFDPYAQPAAGPPPLAPVAQRRRRRVPSVLGYFAVAALAAVLATAGTVGVLQANGTFDQARAAATSAPTAPSSVGQTVSLPLTDSSSAVVAAAAKVGPSVVTITTRSSSSRGLGGTAVGIGSGLIFDSNGWILTNHHVVADGGSLSVALADGRTFDGTVYGTDTLTDLAIVKIDATGLPAASLGDSSKLRPGELVVAIGDPLGGYPNSVTAGIVSGLNRSIDASGESLSDLIQTDAAINPGNSGGPLINAAGQVIGLNTAASTSAQGMGFAIPINLARPLTEQALAGKQLARPWIGVRFVQLDPATAAQNKLSVSQGAWVTSDQTSGPAIQAGSPAEKAGLKDGDIITAVDGAPVDTSHPLIEVISSHAPGSTVTLTVHRGSSNVDVKLTLSTRPAGTAP